MRVYRHFNEIAAEHQGGAIAIGNFDGVHLGHAHIARQLVARAKQYGGPAIVFTFDPHPVHLHRACMEHIKANIQGDQGLLVGIVDLKVTQREKL